MHTLKKSDYFTAGLAIFAMFFGAGNIIFPLALGKFALNFTPWALAGLLLTAVAMPFLGLFAMLRYRGEIRLFFGRLGKIPGLIIATITIAILGPFGAAPRCIALAYSTLSASVPGIPLILFSGVACLLILCFTLKKNGLLKLLGFVLSPFKIILLVWIIIKGFMEAPDTSLISLSSSETSHFWHGLTEGYKTMDLLAAFFFAPIILSSLGRVENEKDFKQFALRASCIGGILLASIYVGFCYLAYFYAPQLEGISPDGLLGAIAIKILGKHAGLIVGLTVTVACLSTAIALIAAFTNFIQKEVLNEKVNHVPILLGTLLLTFGVTTLKFQGIAQFLNPLLELFYPALILLTFYNLIMPIGQGKGIFKKRDKVSLEV